MILIYLTSLLLFVVILFWRRERRFLKKSVREALSEEMKVELNLPGTNPHFEKKLALQDQTQKRASRKILEEMNKASP